MVRSSLRLTTSLAALCALFAQPTWAQQRIDTSGELQKGDPALASGEFYDSFILNAAAGDRIDVRLSSDDFDPYLIVEGPGEVTFENDDGAEGSLDARIDEVAPVGGSYRLIATSFEAGESGAYQLQASASRSAGGGSGSGAANRQTGTLAEGDDQLDSGEFTDAYTFEGRAGDAVDIQLSSAEFDTYLLLRGPDGSSFENDDGEDSGTNARLVETLPATGTYRLVVTSYASGESGAYVLETQGATAVALASSGGGSGIGSSGGGQRLAIGSTASGQLAEGDPQLENGEYFDVYTLAAEPGTRLVLEMQSSAVDTYLAAFGSGGYEVSNDDDASGQNGTNSTVEVTIPDGGELTVAATSYAAGETGSYTLMARLAGSSARTDADDGDRLALGASVAGALAASDRRGDGSVEDSYLIAVDRSGPVRLALSSGDFDPVLLVEGPGGFRVENDDAPSGDTLDSLVEAVLPEAGTYRVTVASYNAEGLGSYRLETGGGSGGAAVAVGAGTLALGSAIAGALAEGDETISSGEFTDIYRFEGSRGQRVTFDMSSSEFDTYLSLLFPGGGQEENDDRAGGEGTTDSRLTVTLPEDGVYQLVATSYQPGEAGGYTISMQTADAIDATIDPRRGSGRVFALNVGVADYQRIGSLDLTDQDALKLTQTLQTTGMLAGESVTLVNSDATRANFIAAIEQISAAIGPDDLFLLFFSGHGSKNPVERFMERDGSSETIELFDAAVSDYELAQMLEPIAARTLLVLDSCFSGGFDDVINRRVGRMGVFSSDSDLTSLVASKFQAGGYISHILQLAVEGQADANHDLAITAGELSEYMRTTFYSIALAEPLDATVYGAGGSRGSGYQHIVVNRGGDGMPYEEVLVNLSRGQVSAGDRAEGAQLVLAD